MRRIPVMWKAQLGLGPCSCASDPSACAATKEGGSNMRPGDPVNERKLDVQQNLLMDGYALFSVKRERCLKWAFASPTTKASMTNHGFPSIVFGLSLLPCSPVGRRTGPSPHRIARGSDIQNGTPGAAFLTPLTFLYRSHTSPLAHRKNPRTSPMPLPLHCRSASVALPCDSRTICVPPVALSMYNRYSCTSYDVV